MLQPHCDPCSAGQQQETSPSQNAGRPAECSELVEDGGGFHHINHAERLPRPGPGPGFPTRASRQRAPGLTPKLPHQHSLGSPRGTHGFSRVSAHTLQQTGRGPRGTFNTCQELPAGADPGHPTHCLTSDRALRSLAQPSPQGLKRMKPASEVRRVRAEATLPRWHCWQDPHG